jgi:hypothetical protein
MAAPACAHPSLVHYPTFRRCSSPPRLLTVALRPPYPRTTSDLGLPRSVAVALLSPAIAVARRLSLAVAVALHLGMDGTGDAAQCRKGGRRRKWTAGLDICLSRKTKLHKPQSERYGDRGAAYAAIDASGHAWIARILADADCESSGLWRGCAAVAAGGLAADKVLIQAEGFHGKPTKSTCKVVYRT